MTTVTEPSPSSPQSPSSPPRLTAAKGARRRYATNLLATVLIALSFVIAMVPLVFLVVYVIQRGAQALSWSFLTQNLPIIERLPGGGMGPAVYGTLLITGAAAAMAIPLGILGGIYLNEYGRTNPLARVIRFLSEVMTGVPSIVMGLFIYTFVILKTQERNAFAGSLALAALMLPIIIRTTDEMLKLVPGEQREGSYALGSRRARTIRTVVLPHAAPGIVSGALLAVARAAGETAPLLFTIGIVTETNTSLFHGPNTALSVQIFHNATLPFTPAQDRAWGAALALILIVFTFTILARLVTAFFSRRQGA